jgi:hypothetical protein
VCRRRRRRAVADGDAHGRGEREVRIDQAGGECAKQCGERAGEHGVREPAVRQQREQADGEPQQRSDGPQQRHPALEPGATIRACAGEIGIGHQRPNPRTGDQDDGARPASIGGGNRHPGEPDSRDLMRHRAHITTLRALPVRRSRLGRFCEGVGQDARPARYGLRRRGPVAGVESPHRVVTPDGGGAPRDRNGGATARAAGVVGVRRAVGVASGAVDAADALTRQAPR